MRRFLVDRASIENVNVVQQEAELEPPPNVVNEFNPNEIVRDPEYPSMLVREVWHLLRVFLSSCACECPFVEGSLGLHFDDLGTVTSESREVEGAVTSPGDGEVMKRRAKAVVKGNVRI
ncbi:hypothetical protein JHK85_032302 [Glycine max]|nr:hypothetical protein JHK85_032302 [Glycine max]